MTTPITDEPRNVLQLEQAHVPIGATPADIAMRWATAGALVRLTTGIEPLDRLCRGGLPVPWRVFIVGAPSAGKTACQTVIARWLAAPENDRGPCVGILAVDEDPEDVTVRFAQMAGFLVADVEARDPAAIEGMRDALAVLRVRLYDARHTIEAAAADLATWAQSEGRPGALFIDSIQAARSEAALEARNPREHVEANTAAMRVASTVHRLLVVATAEANRAAYRSDAQDQNDLAAGAESRAIEYGAQTQLVLRTPKGHADVIHVRVAKNRRAHIGEFWLRLDREAHTLTECDDPASDAASAEDRAVARTASKRAQIEHDTGALVRLVLEHPGESTRTLRELAAAKLGWGKDRVGEARALLESGASAAGKLVNRGSGARSAWYAEGACRTD